ncbi:tetratricopeptide repeat domain 18 [Perkinsus olseni]|uniref:Tetratricopeptide repeat domain 18 n=1 Tax=Perkinsus olseni TaxID=32597 RepID=A0A7J6M1R8_PEROL|nr:tetratricopeptide repeat domain 18 [Perkinsus olseni]KAF4665435.1 tetratricopeptide repeat domain 18 [Perkinsus olseni]
MLNGSEGSSYVALKAGGSPAEEPELLSDVENLDTFHCEIEPARSRHGKQSGRLSFFLCNLSAAGFSFDCHMPAAAEIQSDDALSDHHQPALSLSASVEYIEGLTAPYNTSLELDLTSISQEPLTARSKASGDPPNEGSPLSLSGWTFERPDSGDDDEPSTTWVVGIRRDANFQTKICLGSQELRLLDEDRQGAVIASGRVSLRSLLHQTTTIEGIYPLTLAAEYAAVTEGSGEPQEEGTDQVGRLVSALQSLQYRKCINLADVSRGPSGRSPSGPKELGAEQAPTLDALVKISSDTLIGNVEDFPSDWRVLTLQVHGMYSLPQPLIDAADRNNDQVVGEEVAACFQDDSHPLQYTIALGDVQLSGGRLHRWSVPPVVVTAADDDHEEVESGKGDGSDNDTPPDIRVEAEEFRRKIEALGYPVSPSAVRALYEALADGRQGCITKASFGEGLSVEDRAEDVKEAARVAGLLHGAFGGPEETLIGVTGRPVTEAPNMITQKELAKWLQQVSEGAGEEQAPQPVEGSDAVDEEKGHATAKVIFGLLGVSEGGLQAQHLTALYLYRRVEMMKNLGMLRKVCIAASGSIADAYEAMGSEKGVDVHGFADYMKTSLSEEAGLSGEDIDLIFHWLDSDGDGYVSAADIMVLENSEVFETLLQLKTAAEILSGSNRADGAMTRGEVERLLMAEDTFNCLNSGITTGHVFNFLALNRSGTVDDETVRFMAQLHIAGVCGLVKHFRTWALKRFGTVDNILSYLGKEVGMEDSETPQLGPLIKWGPHTVEAYKGRRFLRTVRALHCGSSSHELEDQWLYIDISVPEATPESTNKKGGKKDGGAGGDSDDLKNLAKRYRGKARVPLGKLASTRSIEGVAAVVTAEPGEVDDGNDEEGEGLATYESSRTYVRYSLAVDRPVTALDTTILQSAVPSEGPLEDIIPEIVEEHREASLEERCIEKIVRSIAVHVLPALTKRCSMRTESLQDALNCQEPEGNGVVEALVDDVRSVVSDVARARRRNRVDETRMAGRWAGYRSYSDLFAETMELVDRAIEAAVAGRSLSRDEKHWRGEKAQGGAGQEESEKVTVMRVFFPSVQLFVQEGLFWQALAARYTRLSFEAEASGWPDRAILFFEKRLAAVEADSPQLWFEYARLMCRVSSVYGGPENDRTVTKIKSIAALQRCLALCGIAGTLTDAPTDPTQRRQVPTAALKVLAILLAEQGEIEAALRVFSYILRLDELRGCEDTYLLLASVLHEIKETRLRDKYIKLAMGSKRDASSSAGPGRGFIEGEPADESDDAEQGNGEPRCDADGMPIEEKLPAVPIGDLPVLDLLEDLIALGLGDTAQSILDLIDGGLLGVAAATGGSNRFNILRVQMAMLTGNYQLAADTIKQRILGDGQPGVGHDRNQTAWLYLGECCFKLSKKEEALSAFETAAKTFTTPPKDPIVYLRMGTLYSEMGDLTKASEAFKRSLRLQQSSLAWVGLALVERKRCNPSLKLLTAANSLDPYRAAIWADLCAESLRGDATGAAKAMRAFMRTSGMGGDLQDRASAIEFLSKEVQCLDTLIDLAEALLVHGEFAKQAETLIRRYQRCGVKGVAESARVAELLARSLAQQGRWEEACTVLEGAAGRTGGKRENLLDKKCLGWYGHRVAG